MVDGLNCNNYQSKNATKLLKNDSAYNFNEQF